MNVWQHSELVYKIFCFKVKHNGDSLCIIYCIDPSGSLRQVVKCACFIANFTHVLHKLNGALWLQVDSGRFMNLIWSLSACPVFLLAD